MDILPKRRSVRLPDYNYASLGFYFVTVCAYHHEHLFGEIVNNEMLLNDLGKVAQSCWLDIPTHYPKASIDAHVIMPNHIHGIIIINSVGANNYSPANVADDNRLVRGTSKTIGAIVRGYKIGVTKWARLNGGQYCVWQRNYYERIIRYDRELNNMRIYIANNMLQWADDEENINKLGVKIRANSHSPLRLFRVIPPSKPPIKF